MWKYIPTTIGVVEGRGLRYYPVDSVRAHPPGHSAPAIRKDFWAVEVRAGGRTRWFGYEAAPVITSALRMAVKINPRDEVQRAWEDVDRADAKALKG